MTIQELEEQIIQLKHQKPFRPFEVELLDGRVIKIRRPNLCINSTGAGYLSAKEGIVDFEFDEVRCFRPQRRNHNASRLSTSVGTRETSAMKTPQLEFEEQIVHFIHQEPFQPFAVEMSDGRIIEIRRPSVVINGGGATYLSKDYEIVVFEFDEIQSVSPLKRKAKR